MLFDKLKVISPPGELPGNLAFLESRGVLERLEEKRFEPSLLDADILPASGITRPLVIEDIMVRQRLIESLSGEADVVGIYQLSPPAFGIPCQVSWDDNSVSKTEMTISVGTAALPVPDETCAFEDILNFKHDLHSKQWAFRRFLKSMTTKSYTEAELAEEIEWMLNEYGNAMKLHNRKRSQGFFEVYVVPVVEIMEDIAKFNWTKIARGAIAVHKRKIELMEAEMKAPGRECAYVFDARQRFGGK